MEMILVNAKTTDWMKRLSAIELPKPTHRKVFQWMENEIIPIWLFLEIADRVLTIDDDEYFDEYNIDHHFSVDNSGYWKKQLCFHQLVHKTDFEIVFIISLILYILLFLSCMLIFPVVQARFPHSIVWSPYSANLTNKAH